MNEAEIRIAQDILPRDWTLLRDVVVKVIAFFGGPYGPGLVMINRYLHEELLDLALVAPDGTMMQFSRTDCGHRTIHAPFNPAEGVRVEPNEAGQYLARLAKSTSAADRQLPAADGPEPSQLSQAQRHKLSGKEWVPIAFERRRDELLAMDITGASHALAEESKTADDCAKPLTARYIEKLLRELRVFPKAHRK
jgi:hypothetical protein